MTPFMLAAQASLTGLGISLAIWSILHFVNPRTIGLSKLME